LENPEKIETRINFKSETFKKYFKNTSWLLGEKIFRVLLSFFVSILVIRYLGPDDFGLLSYAISFYGLFTALSVLGLESISIRELVKHPDRRDKLLGSVFGLRFLGGIITLAIIIIVLLSTGESYDTSLLIIIISISAIFQSFSVVDYYFRSKVEARYSVYVLSSSVLISSLIKLLMVYWKAPLIYFAIIFSFEFLIAAIGFITVYKKREMKLSKWKFDKLLSVELLKDSWPLILTGLVVSIYMKIDQVMIKNMLNNEQVGYYAAAVRLSEAWYFIPIAITNSLFPAIVHAKNISEEFYNNRMQKLYDILAWLSIAIALPVSFFSKEIIQILLGNIYSPSAPILTIYIWAGVAVFLGIASSQYLINENYTKLSFFRTFIGMIINVILNFILIPVYGIAGAAVATLISYTVAVYSIFLFPRTRRQFIMMVKSLFFIDFIKQIIKSIVKDKND